MNKNKLIDLIASIRICHNATIELELYKELLNTKFLSPISIDDNQNLIINSIVSNDDLNFLPLYVKENDIKGKDRELEYLELSIENVANLLNHLKTFNGVSINPRTTNFNIKLDDLKSIIKELSGNRTEILDDASKELSSREKAKLDRVFNKFDTINKIFLLKVRGSNETNFHWLVVIDCLNFDSIIPKFSREIGPLFPKGEILDFLPLKTQFSYDIVKDCLPIYKH